MSIPQGAILVNFGDNDFYKTWLAVLDSFASNPELFRIKDKKVLAFILSQAAFGMYVMHQNQCRYDGMEKMDEAYIIRMREYLTVTAEQILIGEEVAEFITNCDGWNNSDSFYVYEYERDALAL